MGRIRTDAIGIPNHKLQKNLQLNGKYLSNDGGDEGIRIDNNGKVGIGTTAPDELFEVQSVGSDTKMRISAFSTTNTECGTIQFVKGEDAVADQWTNKTDSGESIGRLDFISTPSDDDAYNASAQILVKQLGTAGTNYVPTQIVFSTSNDGTGAPTQKMCIRNDGHVGIGDTSPDYRLGLTDTSTQLRIAYDENEYATFGVADDGELTIKTTSAGTADDIILDAGRYVYFYTNGSSRGWFSYLGSTFGINSISPIKLTTSGSSTDITLNPKGNVIIQSDGGTFTPSADAHVATKKYVDDELAGGGSARSVAGDTDNALISWVTSDNTFAAEANLTFDGTDLLIASTGKLAVGDTATYIHQASDSNLAVVADGDITLDADDDIVLDADGDKIHMKFGTAGQIDFTNANSGDGIIQQKVNAKDLVIQQYDGDEVIRFRDDSHVNIQQGKRLYLDGGGDTYISNSASDVLDIVVGGTMFVRAMEGVNGQMDWLFRDAAVGFDINTAIFNATDTDVDFTQGNKCKLTLTGDIQDVHFKFPNISGNFVCLFIQDGTGGWNVSTWKTKDSAGNAGNGNSGEVLWPGGTATSLTETANKTDIISLFWDADTETAYALASENF
tara:strand:- start:1186 stop:3030 length:1845 start_codon:yes stop_codon:yes gene_type:complete